MTRRAKSVDRHPRRPPPAREWWLYLAGRSPNSLRAHARLQAIIATLATPPIVRIIDVLVAPDEALAAGIIVTPTLVRMRPEPRIKLIGDLGDTSVLLSCLGMAVPARDA